MANEAMHTLNSRERGQTTKTKDKSLVAEENDPEPQLCLRCSWRVFGIGQLILKALGRDNVALVAHRGGQGCCLLVAEN